MRARKFAEEVSLEVQEIAHAEKEALTKLQKQALERLKEATHAQVFLNAKTNAEEVASYSGANLSSDEIGYNHHEARERLRCKALDDMLLPLRMTGREGKAEAEARALGASEPAIEERRQQACKTHAKEKLAQQLATLPNMRLSLNEKGAFGRHD